MIKQITQPNLATVKAHENVLNLKQILFLFLVLIGGSSQLAHAQIYLNAFTGTAACPTQGNVPTVITNATGTILSRNTITCNSTANVFNSTTLNVTSFVSNTSYIEFSVTANAGYQINATSLSFFRQASNSAPNQLEVRYSTDGFATSTSWSAAPNSPTSGNVISWDFSDISTSIAGTISFRFYPFGTTRADGGTPAATTGTFRLDDVTLNGTVTAPASASISTGALSPAGSFSTNVGSASSIKTFTLVGSNLTSNLTVDSVSGYEYSDDGFATSGQSTLSFTGVNVSKTISVRLTGATVGTYNGNIAIASIGASGSPLSIALTGNVNTLTPTITVGTLTPGTSFSALSGNTSAIQTFNLNVTNLISNLIIDAVPGYEYSDDGFVSAGQVSLLYTTPNVTKVISVRLTGSSVGTFNGAINISSVGAINSPTSIAVNGSVTLSPTITEVIMPQFIEGVNGTNSNRIPFACYLTINNLTANAIYNFYPAVVIAGDATTSNGAGNALYVSAAGFTRSTSPGFTAGNFGTFTASAGGSYSGWFVIEPTGNATRFIPGNNIFVRINLNDGAGGTTVVSRPTTTNFATVLNLNSASASTSGTALRGLSSASEKNFALTYDNVTGGGRPISASFIESDGSANTIVNSYAAFYGNNVDGILGAYGVVIPNINSNGIRRIENRSLSNASLVGCAVDADGVWPSGANTVNPGGGTTAILISSSDALLTNCCTNAASSSTTTICSNQLPYSWNTQSITAAGTYTYTATIAGGCDSVATLILIVNATTSSTVAHTACDSFLWTANNMTYTTSGTYTYTSLNAAGCTKTDTLILTINNSSSTSLTQTACDSYTWAANNVTYTASGTYTFTSLNAAGCANTATLILTINNSTTSSSTISASNSYLWPVNGVTYTASGTYTSTSLNAANCLHTSTLVLTITSTSIPCQISSFIQNVVSTSTYVEFDIALTNTGSGLLQLQSFQAGINLGAISNFSLTGGSVIVIDQPNAPGAPFAGLTNGIGLNFFNGSGGAAGTLRQIRITQVGVTGNAVAMTPNVNMKFCRVRFTNASPFTANTNANLTFAPSNFGGGTNPNANVLAINGASCAGSLNQSNTLLLVNGANTILNPQLSGPTSSVLSGNATICEGQSSNLSVAITGGTSPYTVTVNDGTSNFTGSGANPVTIQVSPLTTKTYSIVSVIDNAMLSGTNNSGNATITMNPLTSTSTTATACNSYTWTANNQTYTASGTYTFTSLNAQNCTNTATLNLTINQNTTSSTSATACNSYTWTANNQTYTASGTYTFTSLNAQSCTNTATLNLTINQNTTSSITATACNSYTWTENNQTYTTSGSYTFTSLNAQNCTNTATLNLTINQNTTSSTTATACNSYTWTANNQTYTASGTYTFTSLNAQSCTNTATLNLTINQNTTSSTSATACNSYTWTANNQTYTASGTYTFTSLNAQNCTNTATLNLTINQNTTSSTTATACNSYTWTANNQTYTASGTYTFTSLNAQNCTNTATLNLMINQNTTSSTTATACNSYTWTANNQTYTASGTYTFTSLNAQNCTNTATLNLTINQNTTSSTSATACNSYTWTANNQTYTASGTYTFTSLNAQSCTNTATLNLTINQNTTSSITATACNSYTWTENNQTYTTSGSYTFTSLNAQNCTNTATLNLTINQNTTSSTTATACNSYTWTANNQTYTASGTYTFTSLNAQSCTNTATLNLTINQNTTSTITATTCNSYTWTANNQTYTASGTYTFTSLNAQNCTNTATLNLTINQNTTSSTTATACNSYTWTANNQTYTASGTYTFTSLNAQNCTNTATLNLMINQNTTSSTTATACNTYTWTANNQTYTASGTYTFTSLNVQSCTNTATLNLTINQNTTSSISATACNSYTWTENNQTYTTSGSYTFTSLNAQNCTNTATLNLMINQNTTSSISATACNSYTWTANNQTYTASGTYTNTSLNASNCVQTEILVLTINLSSTVTTTVSASGSYTWSINGVTYMSTGIYTHTTLNATTGCTITHILNLSISNGILGVKLCSKVFLAGPYDINTGLMSDSLRVKNLIPTIEPYSAMNKPVVVCLNGETISTSILSNQGVNSIVDWVYLELRSATNPSTIIATKRALLQRDGDIVSHVDGISLVEFDGVTSDNYYVSVKHRNHLGVMTLNPVALSVTSLSCIDFSTDALYTMSSILNSARKTVGTVKLLWSADANNNKNVKYNGLSNDKDNIITSLGGPVFVNSILSNVYRNEDVNMDSKIKYNGVDNDRVIIINNIGVSTPNNVIYQHTPN